MLCRKVKIRKIQGNKQVQMADLQSLWLKATTNKMECKNLEKIQVGINEDDLLGLLFLVLCPVINTHCKPIFPEDKLIT